MKPEICEDCGEKSAIIHGHHEDYSTPLSVNWLCPKCHKLRHRIKEGTALTPAEQAEKDSDGNTWVDPGAPPDIEGETSTPTHPGGDSRVVAKIYGIYLNDGRFMDIASDVEQDAIDMAEAHYETSDYSVRALVPLSSLEAVERERDHFETEALQFEIVAKGLREKVVAAEASLAAAREALTPSGDTKAEYIGEFQFTVTMMELDDSDEPFECQRAVTVPWTTIKEIMAAISARAALTKKEGSR